MQRTVAFGRIGLGRVFMTGPYHLSTYPFGINAFVSVQANLDKRQVYLTRKISNFIYFIPFGPS